MLNDDQLNQLENARFLVANQMGRVVKAIAAAKNRNASQQELDLLEKELTKVSRDLKSLLNPSVVEMVLRDYPTKLKRPIFTVIAGG